MSLLVIGLLVSGLIVGVVIEPVITLAVIGVFMVLVCLIGLGKQIYTEYRGMKDDIKRLDQNIEKLANLHYAVFELKQRVDRIDG